MSRVEPVLRGDLEAALRHMTPAQMAAKEQPRGPARIVCCCLHRESELRRRACKIVMNPRFDKFIMMLIFLNSIALAAYDPTTLGGARNSTCSQMRPPASLAAR